MEVVPQAEVGLVMGFRHFHGGWRAHGCDRLLALDLQSHRRVELL